MPLGSGSQSRRAANRLDLFSSSAASHAFSEADERLVATIASSMGVALENARLFDETKRLLGETSQRNAELAVINDISEALAKQLDFDSITEAVGERIRSIFDVSTVMIARSTTPAKTSTAVRRRPGRTPRCSDRAGTRPERAGHSDPQADAVGHS